MALNTVSDYIVAARTLLQDELEPVRYTDAEIKEAIGLGLYEARSKRPELFLGRMENIPDIHYRSALLFYIVGTVMLRDEEESVKADAAGYLNRFVAKLLSLAS